MSAAATVTDVDGQPLVLLLSERTGRDIAVTVHDAIARMGLNGGGSSGAQRGSGSMRAQLRGLSAHILCGAAARVALDGALASGPPPHVLGMAPPDVTAMDVVALTPVDGGAHDPLETAQSLCAIAALLTPLARVHALFWRPAALWTPASSLAEAAVAIDRQGLPPVLHVVSFTLDDMAPAGAEEQRRSLTSHGLGWFGVADMRLFYPAGQPFQWALRRATRLAIDAMVNGWLPAGTLVDGMEPGERILFSSPGAVDGAHTIVLAQAVMSTP